MAESYEKRIKNIYKETCDVGEKISILLIKDDDAAKRLLAAWPNVEREVVNKGKDIWGGLSFSFDEWCDFAGIPPSNFNFLKCQKLMRLGLVLPDGTLHYWINLYLSQEAGSHVMEEKAKVSVKEGEEK